jgi:signal transduction histidine kinase
MRKNCIIFCLLAGTLVLCRGIIAAGLSSPLVIRSIEVDGKQLKFKPNESVNLGAFPEHILFKFGVASNSLWAPSRLISRLDGVDPAWHRGGGFMYLILRFYNSGGDRLDVDKQFVATGNSAGWTGTLSDSTLTHRRETVTVPKGASYVWAIISSAGPPSTTGIYVVDNLTISRPLGPNGKVEALLRWPFDSHSVDLPENQAPTGWLRDGIHPSMAKVVEIGHEPKTKAFAIMDDDRFGHAEWHNDRVIAPKVEPNEQLIVEWNEMYSIGDSGNSSATYDTLAPGKYQFRVAEADIFGKPTGVEASVAVRVPVAIWETPWFWAMAAAVTIGSSFTSARYVARRRMQRTIAGLQQQRLLENERLRIARDIHDDLGARVTQISLLSAMAQSDEAFPEKARAQFDRISVMSRDLVSALYETVWAVNPENDNLEAMVNYLCERITELCNQSQLRCRLHVAELPKNVVVFSRGRHNISMVLKEAMNNIIKHAKASQVNVRVSLVNGTLELSIEDDGCGFPDKRASAGNGLANMKHRMQEIGGDCRIESSPGKGTTIRLKLDLMADGAEIKSP